MNKEEVKQLAKKFLDGTATVEEQATLHNWYTANLTDEEELVFTSKPESRDEVKNRIFTEVRHRIAKNKGGRSIKLWLRIAAAASIIIAISAGTWFFGSVYKNSNAPISANDIAPGKNTATLTLSDGSKLILSDAANGNLAEQNGVTITKTADGQVVYKMDVAAQTGERGIALNTLTTAKGEQYQIALPDGTRVWLNAATSLTFPATFANASQRKVELSGEAYFEVAKNKKQPFIVKTDKQQVEVLGTHFNISSYSDEQSAKTTLVEGSIKINTSSLYTGGEKMRESILKPGQQSTLNSKGIITIEQVAVDDATAWKNGKFVFDNESIESIMRRLVRWYDFEVIYEGQDVKELPFTGSISRYSNISKILDKITYTQNIHFKIEGRRITVMK